MHLNWTQSKDAWNFVCAAKAAPCWASGCPGSQSGKQTKLKVAIKPLFPSCNSACKNECSIFFPQNDTRLVSGGCSSDKEIVWMLWSLEKKTPDEPMGKWDGSGDSWFGNVWSQSGFKWLHPVVIGWEWLKFPLENCNILAVHQHQLWCGEGNFTPWGLLGKAQSLPVVRPQRSHRILMWSQTPHRIQCKIFEYKEYLRVLKSAISKTKWFILEWKIV